MFRLGPASPAVKDGIGVAKTHGTLHAAIEAPFKAMIADGPYRDILHRYRADAISIAGP